MEGGLLEEVAVVRVEEAGLLVAAEAHAKRAKVGLLVVERGMRFFSTSSSQ